MRVDRQLKTVFDERDVSLLDVVVDAVDLVGNSPRLSALLKRDNELVPIASLELLRALKNDRLRSSEFAKVSPSQIGAQDFRPNPSVGVIVVLCPPRMPVF